MLPGSVVVVGFQEKEHSVLKLHKECKQNKWNLSEVALIPCWRSISGKKKKSLCVAFDEVSLVFKILKEEFPMWLSRNASD